MDQMSNGANVCVCKHRKVVPMAMLIAGVLFILQGLGILTGISFPLVFGVLLVIIGWIKLTKGKCKC